MLSIHLELLDEKRKNVFLKLKSFEGRGYLVGDTALSLQIGHRHSFDFDIFLNREILRKDHALLRKYFKIKRTDLNTSEQLDVITKDDIKITLCHYLYNPIFSLVKTDSLSLVSVKDIAADKAFTIGKRGVWRDYVDMFFLLKKLSIGDIIKFAEKKFKKEFNSKLFLEQLTYFKDLRRFDISFIKEKYSEDEVKKYLIKQVKNYQNKVIKK
ncbi:hypothetical protein KJ684_00575 [Patescibacteria group bacterium]|nr:hypothetical protein [Patescibacteria group bacterium]